jgi:hypothetical protein
MNSELRTSYVTRNDLMKMLSDDEITKVSAAEAATPLSDGEEFLDLEHLDKGVQRAKGHSAAMGVVLPKKSVSEKTWSKLIAKLTPTESAAAAPPIPPAAATAAKPAASRPATAS